MKTMITVTETTTKDISPVKDIVAFKEQGHTKDQVQQNDDGTNENNDDADDDDKENHDQCYNEVEQSFKAVVASRYKYKSGTTC